MTQQCGVHRLLIGLAVCGTISAHDVVSTKITWSREISRIVYKRCVSCHREGGTAFSLVNYQEARPWAKAIKEEVLNRRMPPWNAVKGFGEFKNEAGLTQEQIGLIADWVEGGAPEGDRLLLPSQPRAPESSVTDRPGAPYQVPGSLFLRRAIAFSAIRAGKLAPGASVQVTATLPDGSVKPLLWVRGFTPAHDPLYYFAEPLRLAAGSRIQTWPATATVTLYGAGR